MAPTYKDTEKRVTLLLRKLTGVPDCVNGVGYRLVGYARVRFVGDTNEEGQHIEPLLTALCIEPGDASVPNSHKIEDLPFIEKIEVLEGAEAGDAFDLD